MNITDVKVFPVREAKLKAYVSIVLDQSFMVNDLKIIQGRDGLFISMPSRRRRNGTYRDIAHPLNSDTRQVLQDRVLAAYHALTGDDGEVGVANGGPEPSPARAADPVAGSVPPPPAALAEERVAAPEPLPLAEEPAVAAEPAQTAGEVAEEQEQSLKEVEEAHLSDTFWTMS